MSREKDRWPNKLQETSVSDSTFFQMLLHVDVDVISEFMGKTFQAAQLTHERFFTIDPSCKVFFWYLPNWTSTNLWCVVLYATYSTTHQRSVEVQFGRYQKNILQEWCRVKKLSCVSCGSLKHFPHTFTNGTQLILDGHGNNLDSFRISFESFRSFDQRSPIPPGQELFLSISYSKPALGLDTRF